MLLGTDTTRRGVRPTAHTAAAPSVTTVSLLPVVASSATDTATCACGHGQEAHEHYRPGSDCALCDCPRFRRRR
ncbi:hypothetical protein C1N91_10060 [Curtobacterium sp. SGAir0471]|nr:hypothetical protein C1N91_10060 [Curtobacterium sp. SGAir0471]